jgi:hypothetical protein
MLYQQSLSSAFNTVGDVWRGISQAVGAANQVSVLLRTVTFYANLAHSLTRSP